PTCRQESLKPFPTLKLSQVFGVLAYYLENETIGSTELDESRTFCPPRGCSPADGLQTVVTVRFLADEDLDSDIIKGSRNRRRRLRFCPGQVGVFLRGRACILRCSSQEAGETACPTSSYQRLSRVAPSQLASPTRRVKASGTYPIFDIIFCAPQNSGCYTCALRVVAVSWKSSRPYRLQNHAGARLRAGFHGAVP